MKYKKIGDILIIDEKYDNLEKIAEKHNVKTIMRITNIQGSKREPNYQILYGNETETINNDKYKFYLII